MYNNENQHNNDYLNIQSQQDKDDKFFYEVVKNQPRKSSVNGEGNMTKFVVGMFIVSLVGGAAAGSSFAFTREYLNREQLSALYADDVAGKTELISHYVSVSDIAEDVGPSIVSIVNTQRINTRMGAYSQDGIGSGVIFQEDNNNIYMITNAHVVEGASSLTVTFLGNYKVPATLVGMDTITDIAVVAVDKTEVPNEIRGEIKMAPLGDSDELAVGELAIAIGTPLDEAYNNTVTVGVISAVNRIIAVSDDVTMELIQTDAAINPGNSGGALIGPTGEVVGINTIKLVDSTVEGMGFAIPINNVKPIVEELMMHGRVVRPSLGITGATMTQEIGSKYDMPVGVYIASVLPGSSAAIAGILPHDIILEFDGEKIISIEDLKSLLEKKSVDDIVTVKFMRNNEMFEVDVVLTEIR
ncbi:MAG: hypothetical protein ATN35_09005 [Epulopiscium sp. Nele67-Bin004]|nr:MAG: hypothetical protein ATN35_09005 [Epulopiscium sp. Nele67-Bin004]